MGFSLRQNCFERGDFAELGTCPLAQVHITQDTHIVAHVLCDVNKLKVVGSERVPSKVEISIKLPYPPFEYSVFQAHEIGQNRWRHNRTPSQGQLWDA